MHLLRQSTAVKVRIGPAMDATDGVTPETTLALGTADQAELLKHDGAATVDISSNTFAAVTSCDGWYDLSLTTTDTNTLGQLDIVIQDSSLMAPLFRSYGVVPANVWDSMFGSDKLEVDMVAQGGLTLETGTAQAGAAGSITFASGASSVTDFYKRSRVLIVAGTGAGQGGVVASYNGATKVATMVDNWATTPSTDSVYLIIPVGVSIVDTANPLPVQVVDITAAGVAKLFSVNSGTTYASAVAGSAVKEIADNAGGSSLTEAGIADAVLDELLSGHSTAGSLGQAITDILADTGELQTDWVNGGRLDLLLDAVKAKTDSMTFTVAGVLDSNIQALNDVTLVGNGTTVPFTV